MSKRERTYQVVSRSAVTVEFPDGNAVSYPPGFSFQAQPGNASLMRLMRINSVREVTSRELPNFNVTK